MIGVPMTPLVGLMLPTTGAFSPQVLTSMVPVAGALERPVESATTTSNW